jgi:bacillithiol biosynthesis deacetylase BshB1
MSEIKLDILAFGAHPDDVDLSCSGTLLKQIKLGYTAGIIDLTQGELGTRGSAELRLKEAAKAASILGVSLRENLSMADGFFQNDKEHQLQIIKKIRQYKPRVVLCNAVSDRHPDHGRASQLVSEACFYSGLRKIETFQDGKLQESWRPSAVYHYIQDRYIKPDFVIDVSPFVDTKMEAIKAFSSQFYDANSKEPESPISSKNFLDFVKSKMMAFGRDINVEYAEGFTCERTIGITDLFQLS